MKQIDPTGLPKRSIIKTPKEPLTSGIDNELSRILSYLVPPHEDLPPHWSTARDKALRDWYLNSDFISSTTSAIAKKLSSVIFRCFAWDENDEQARDRAMISETAWKAAWADVGLQFCLDLLSQDNGGFSELKGAGRATGEITATELGDGMYIGAYGLRHLDAARCTRTGRSDYPVLFTDVDGRIYKLPPSRVFFFSDMPSPDWKLHGVGLCAISRAIQHFSALQDIVTLDAETASDAPANEIILGKHLPHESLKAAYDTTKEVSRERGWKRYKKKTIITVDGDDAKDADIIVRQLRRYPEGFNKEESYRLALGVIALAFGVDLRELWASSETGATKADAETLHEKSKGKLMAWFIRQMEAQLTEKFAPEGCYYKADGQDDSEDVASAAIATSQVAYLSAGITSGLFSKETAWQKAVKLELMTEEQLERQLKELAENTEAMAEQLAPNNDPDEDEEEIKKKSLAGDKFADDISTLIEQLADEKISEDDFNSELEALVIAAALAAWNEGSDGEPVPEELQEEYDKAVALMIASIVGLGLATSGATASELSTIFNVRVPVWVNSIEQIEQLGRVGNPFYTRRIWNVTPGKKHCSTCAGLDGAIKTRGEWIELAATGIYPRSPNLACTGRRCGCSITDV